MVGALAPSSPTSVEFPGAKLFRHLADRIRGVYEALFHEPENLRTVESCVVKTLEGLLGLNGSPEGDKLTPSGHLPFPAECSAPKL